MFSWFRRHAPELIRGSIFGLLAGVIVCVLNWHPCPVVERGQSQEQFQERWGAPARIVENTMPGPQVEGMAVVAKQMHYRCGLFGTSVTVVYVDSNGRIIDAVEGAP